MYILGLHFGHDAGACLINNGKPVCVVLEERITRVKHAIGLSTATIEALLEQTGVQPSQIDYCAVTSTQGIDCISEDGAVLGLAWQRHPDDQIPATLEGVLAQHGVALSDGLTFKLADALYSPDSFPVAHAHFAPLFPRFRQQQREELHNFGTLDRFLQPPAWQQGAGLDALHRQLPPEAFSDALRQGFHVPVTVSLMGRHIPGSFIHHHLAHAASSFYGSGFERAAILTHDGFQSGEGYQGGLLLLGNGNHLYPLTPHHLAIGTCYDQIAHMLGLGWMGGAGKLMGLSAWGSPHLFETRFVGNHFDAMARFGCTQQQAWSQHCAAYIRQQPGARERFANPAHMTEPLNADIAASTQRLFEATRRTAVNALADLLTACNQTVSNLCLSGGSALNCPSNSDLLAGGAFEQLHVEPGCDDSGLALGAALYACHQLLDQPRQAASDHASPYLGRRFARDAISDLLMQHDSSIRWSWPNDGAASAAQDIAADRVIGWFEGASEIGPRALGHRSILANAGNTANWARVNSLKSREGWRPFAPAVLEDDLPRYFSGSPASSPYMLFNAQVTDGGLGAITHADGSARVQSVSADCGQFFRLLTAVKSLTGTGVVLNTSFNGPGEPVVDSPADALSFFLNSELDRLYLDGAMISRKSSSDRPTRETPHE